MIHCMNCNESFHKDCVDIAYKFDPSRKDYPKKFTCDNINISFRKEDIPFLANSDFSTKSKDSMILEANKCSSKRSDFANEENKCSICLQQIPLSTKNHILECTGTGTPLAPALKRIKLSELNKKNKKRMSDFGKIGEKLFKINKADENYHRGIAPVTRKLKRRQIFSKTKK